MSIHLPVSVSSAMVAMIVLAACSAESPADSGEPRAAETITLEPSLTVLPAENDTLWLGSRAVLPRKTGGFAVADPYAHRVVLLNGAGEVEAVHGRSGEGPGEYNSIWALFSHPQGFLVWDFGNGRYTLLSESGDFLDSYSAVPQGPSFIASSYGDGGIVSATFRPENQLLWTHELEPHRDPLWRRIMLTAEHGAEEETDQPNNPRLAGGIGGRIYIGWGERERYRVVAIDTTGRILVEFGRDLQRVERPADELERMVQQRLDGPFGSVRDEGELRRDYRFRSHFRSLHEDGCGRLWVRTERDVADDPPAAFDVFSPEGRLLAEVTLAGRLGSIHIGKVRITGTVPGPYGARGIGIYPLGDVACD